MGHRSIHYAGALRIVRGRRLTRILAGYAACCSGAKAERIADEGAHTYDPGEVTCRPCVRQMERAGTFVSHADTGKVREAYIEAGAYGSEGQTVCGLWLPMWEDGPEGENNRKRWDYDHPTCARCRALLAGEGA